MSLPLDSDLAAAGLAGPTVARVWGRRRQAEKRGMWQRPAMGVLAAAGFTVIAGDSLRRDRGGVRLRARDTAI
ncbi:MAG: hypothetical protein ACK4UY_02405 [Dietzia sp.]